MNCAHIAWQLGETSQRSPLGLVGATYSAKLKGLKRFCVPNKKQKTNHQKK
jgi:hypothetical protein